MKQKQEENNEEVILDKAPYVTFLSLRKCHCVPFRENGRVRFKVTGKVNEALAELSSNPSVPILDFLNRLETIRSIIFQMK